MPRLKPVIAMSLPVVVLLLSTQMVSADELIAYLQTNSLPDGTESYDCSVTHGNQRAPIVAYAEGQTSNGATIPALSSLAGRSGSTSLGTGGVGVRHRASLRTHVVGAPDHLYCGPTNWTSGWSSSQTTNVESCPGNVTSSISQTTGTGNCVVHQYTAMSMGNTNP